MLEDFSKSIYDTNDDRCSKYFFAWIIRARSNIQISDGTESIDLLLIYVCKDLNEEKEVHINIQCKVRSPHKFL